MSQNIFETSCNTSVVFNQTFFKYSLKPIIYNAKTIWVRMDSIPWKKSARKLYRIESSNPNPRKH